MCIRDRYQRRVHGSSEELKFCPHPKNSRNMEQLVMSSSEMKTKLASQHCYATPTHSMGRRKSPVLTSDPRLQLFQRDKEIYESQSKKMLDKIVFLTINLEESNTQVAKYKRLVEDLNSNRLSKSEIGELAMKVERKGSEMLLMLDNSMESHNESFLSSDSAHRERSVSLNTDPVEGEIEKKGSTGLGTPRPEENQNI
eukprot:TRINITY_DN21323_c0_g1_i2.p1 TRINITY_DN21323_c0_g1~~TRINITY_DN21323_c0_g1_i2.p1  ORF type:complete len:198 (+),score=36.94 TRINITY_DN21323_c0_g1_i2:147-740(+)